MGKGVRTKNTRKLEGKLLKVVSAYSRLSRNERRRFVNSVFTVNPGSGMISDRGPENPKLGNRQPQPNAPAAPTSGLTLEKDNIWDYFRNPPAPSYKDQPDDTITPARVTLSVRMRTNPIKGLTFERLVNYLDQWQLGFFRLAGMAWDKMEKRDYQLQVVRPKRLKSVARHGYDILIRDDIDESQEPLAQQQKDFLGNFYANVTATTALNADEEGGMSLLIRQMMDAVGKYYAVHEIVWKPNFDGQGNLTARFIFIPVWWVEGTRGKLRFLQSEFQVYGVDMLPGEWLVTCGDGIMEACSVVYLMKATLLKANLAFLDKFGMPGIHGETDAVKGTAEWNNFVEAMQEFGQEWVTATNRGAKINLIESKANGDAGYSKLLEVFDRAITQLWRGGDLGTKSSQHGTGASLQADESEILETDDSKMIEETLDAKVTKYALAWKFGPTAPALAYIKLRTTPRRNIEDDIAVDTFLSGFKDKTGKTLLGVQATLERYSRPLPKPDEDTLQPDAPPAPDPDKPGSDVRPSKTDMNQEMSFANASLDTNAKEMFLEAIVAEFKQINSDLESIGKLDDPDKQKSRLAEVLAKLDRMQSQLHHDPAIANAIYKILVAGVGNGMAKNPGAKS
jgi:hypothetical protein